MSKVVNTEETFWALVTPTGFCWQWEGLKTDEGYGAYWLDGRTRGVHRIAYELLVGPIPDGMQLDHLCRNRSCANPDHLEVITAGKHSLRSNRWRIEKPTCINGHLRTEDNLLAYDPRSVRCRQCVLVRTHRSRGKNCHYDRFCSAASHERVERRVVPIPAGRGLAP